MTTNDNEAPPLKTPLHSLHQELGARLVPFAGYELPVQYPPGIIKEHLHARAQAGLFDVSHMGQIRLSGDGAAAALETLVPVDVVGLAPLRQRYGLFTNDAGGILDDLMIINAGDHLLLVVNAACKHQDLERLRSSLSRHCQVESLFERALLALQGPAAAAVLARLAPAATELVFMSAAELDIDGVSCFLTRSGYTGEDGFEISVPSEQAEKLARTLLAQSEVAPIGLGARDSLRLEAGLCLYGHDIDTVTTPVEAGLRWALSKARRHDGERPGGYPGASVIMGELARGTAQRRVGILPEGKAPVREGVEITDDSGNRVGRITSGGYGASVGGPVAMGYVSSEYAAPGTPLQAVVRGKPRTVTVVTLPFAPHRYHRSKR